MDHIAFKTGFICIILLSLSGCDDDDSNDDVGYKLAWETSFLLPEGYLPLRGDSNQHHFRIDMYGNAYLSFAQSEPVDPPYMGLEDIAIWRFDGSEWFELPELPQTLGSQDQGYYLPHITYGQFTLIYFRDVNVGAPWRASQTDSVFSANRYDPGTQSWSEFTVLDDDYLDPSANYKLSFGEKLYAELTRYVQLEPTPCEPDWIEGCYTWDEENVYFTLSNNGWIEIDSTIYDRVGNEAYRVVYDGSETQLETLVDGNWEAEGEAVTGEYSLHMGKLNSVPYLYAGSEVLKMCEQGWCNLLDGYDLGQNPIDGLYLDISDNLYIYQALGDTYALYKFSNQSQ